MARPLVGSPRICLRFTRAVGVPGLALDVKAYADPRPGLEFRLRPASSATGEGIAAVHEVAPGLFTTRCSTHGLVVLTIPLYCRDTFLCPHAARGPPSRTAAVTVSTWPPGEDTLVDLCVDDQAVEHSFRRGASRRDAVMTRAFGAVGELLTSA